MSTKFRPPITAVHIYRYLRRIFYAFMLVAIVTGCAVDSGSDQNEVESNQEATSAPAANVAPSNSAPVVVDHDALRVAKAFEDGPVGRPQEESGSKESVPRVAMARPPGTGPGGPPKNPFISVNSKYPTYLGLTYKCGAGTNSITRIEPNGTRVPLGAVSVCASGTMKWDQNLQPGTNYCYELQYSGGKATGCGRTPWAPYLFSQTNLTTQESAEMYSRFDWRKTEPVMSQVNIDGRVQPTLYYMNVLITEAYDLYGLRRMGIHTQADPVFEPEQASYTGQPILVSKADKTPIGAWVYAIVPGPVYNDMRSQLAAAVGRGETPGIRAMVFRSVPISAAKVFSGLDVSALNTKYLGQMGLEFNGQSPNNCKVVNGTRVCTTEHALFGWLARKFISVVVDIVETAVDGVTQAIGAVERLILGDVKLTLKFAIMNTDEAFGTNQRMRSGWSGQELLLSGMRVRVWQNIAQFAGTTDSQGEVTLKVSKKLGGKICIDLDNSFVTLIAGFVMDRRVCVGSFSASSSDQTKTVEVHNKYVNVIAQMTDEAHYLQTVAGFTMPKIQVLTGWAAAFDTLFNEHRAFAPCMGRYPNLMANLALYQLSPGLTELLEFFVSFDIVLPDEAVVSRGVGVHEYGHVVMCELMRSQASHAEAQVAWADVIAATLTGQSSASQQSMTAEAFADFMTLQVVGATNYTSGDNVKGSEGVYYCKDDAGTCMDVNYRSCGSNCGNTDKSREIHAVINVLHDAFDRIPASPAERNNPPAGRPHDGSLWIDNGSFLERRSTANSFYSLENEVLALPGTALKTLFSDWGSLGNVIRYDSFLGGLAKTLARNGYTEAQVCQVFEKFDASGTCPAYVKNAVASIPVRPVNPDPDPTTDPDPFPDDPCWVGGRRRPNCRIP